MPPDVIRKQAYFEGTLIKGGRPLTSVQRIGTFLLGVGFLSLPMGLISVVIQSFRDRGLHYPAENIGIFVAGWLFATIMAAASGYIGWRMLKNAATAPKPRS